MFTKREIPYGVSGGLALSSVVLRAMEATSTVGPVEIGSSTPTDGKGVLKLNPVASVWDGKVYSSSVVFEVALGGVPPLAADELFRDLVLTWSADLGIVVDGNVAFKQPADPRLGFARLEKRKHFLAWGDKIVRRDTETGIMTPVWFVHNAFADKMVVSADRSRLAFSTSNGPGIAIMDTDGTGCTVADNNGAVSPGCNKGYQGVSSTYHASRLLRSSRHGEAIAFQGSTPSNTVFGIDDVNIWLSRTSEPGVSQFTQGVYYDGSAWFSPDNTELYFSSDRPFDDPTRPYNPEPFVPYSGPCGIFKQGVDLATGSPVGSITYVFGSAEWKKCPVFSLDFEGKRIAFALPGSVHGLSTVFSMNLDGTNLKEVGQGIDPVWTEDGQVSFEDREVSGELVLANPDGTEKRIFSTGTFGYFGGAIVP
jgi:hypothetical protein